MQMPRVSVTLEKREAEVLYQMADDDFRQPQEELRWLLVLEARRRGLLAETLCGESSPGNTTQGENIDVPIQN